MSELGVPKVAMFPPRFILAPWLSEATCLHLLTRMFLADVFLFRYSELQPFLLTELKSLQHGFPKEPRSRSQA